MPHAASLFRRAPPGWKGFTLIELVVAVAVIGILAALAFPSFVDSVRKSRRSDAFAALSAVQQAQERWRGQHAGYADNLKLTLAPSATPPGLGLSATSAKGYYGISIDSADATGYAVTATAAAGTTQASDGSCQRLRVRVAGGNIAYGSAPGAGAFDESAGNRCWVR